MSLIYNFREIPRSTFNREQRETAAHILFYGALISQVIRACSITLSRFWKPYSRAGKPCEKLQCLYENLMSNYFRKTAVLKQI